MRRKLHKLKIRMLCWLGQAIDCILLDKRSRRYSSNFTENHFVFDGVECGSMEGFLQSLKHPEPEVQERICSLVGKYAKRSPCMDGRKHKLSIGKDNRLTAILMISNLWLEKHTELWLSNAHYLGTHYCQPVANDCISVWETLVSPKLYSSKRVLLNFNRITHNLKCLQLKK